MKRTVLAILVAAASTGAFAQYDGPEDKSKSKQHVQAPKHYTLANCSSCGTVEGVRQEKRKGEGGAVGIVGGAVVGGLLGNQIGGGSGRALATVGGAVAGGYVGNEIQKNSNSTTVWVTDVRMQDGTWRKYEQASAPKWHAGTIVRVMPDGSLRM